MAPVRKPIQKKQLDPAWFKKTAAIASKRGTALVFSSDGFVYGLIPKTAGSVAIHYQRDAEWVAEILAEFPKGAVFPDMDMYGGPSASKSLRPYASIVLPQDGSGTARIDPVTKTLHVKGAGATIHSAGFGSNDCPSPKLPEEIEALSFHESVVPEIAKLLVECTRREDARPGLRRVYAVKIGGVPHLGATDGRSAIIHKCEGLPEGFSYDPSLVGLHDIVGYRRKVIEETGATVNYYLLSDGTTIVETLPLTERPTIAEVMAKFDGLDRSVVFESAALRKLVEDVSNLGLGVNDSFGGIVMVQPSGVTVMAEGMEVAEIDCAPNLESVEQTNFALPVLMRFAKLGGDFCLCDGTSPAIATAGSTTYLAMPMTFAKNKDAAGQG